MMMPRIQTRAAMASPVAWVVWATAALTAAIAVSVARPVRAQPEAPSTEWRAYAGDTRSLKYSPLAAIDAENVKNLRIRWRSPTPDRAIQESNPVWRASRNEDTPLMVGGVLYAVTGLGLVSALDAATGATRWIHDAESYKNGKPTSVGFAVRGVAYWSDGTTARVFHATSDAYLISLDARTGLLDRGFGDGGRIDLMEGIRDAKRTVNFAGRPPLVAGDVVVAGNVIDSVAPNKEMPPGYVKAFDVRTGKPRWTFHMVPRAGELGFDTWLDSSAEYSGNANVWAGMAYDPELDYVYLPGSSATNDYYGGLRHGDNLFADTLVCVEAKTGRRVWHFQTVHHDVWDYDLPTHPILTDVTVDGRRVKAVVQVTKQGFTYVLDRRTGAPVWPIQERPVPQSTVPRERTSGTQPFPSKPPAFELQGTGEDNLIDFTPELRRQALERLQVFEHGPLFQPPSLKGTLILPGIFGGANWGGAGVDPETGVLYVPSVTSPAVLRLAAGDPQRTNHLYRSGGSGAGVDQATIEGLSIFKPPYSRVTAIDLNKGEHLWMQPLGNGPRHHPLLQGLSLPPLGDQVFGGSVLVTQTLLFVSVTRLQWNGAAAPRVWANWADPGSDRNLIYVFEKKRGTLVHTIELDGQSAAAPMTYSSRGQQYIVVAVGGGPASELVALALPEASAR